MNESKTRGKAGRKRRKGEEKSVTLIKHGISQLRALLPRPMAPLFPVIREDRCAAAEFRLGTV